MPDNPLEPMTPSEGHLTQFNDRQDSFENWHGEVLILGDSRGGQYKRSVIDDALGETAHNIVNLGIAGTYLQEQWWFAINTTVDLSNVKQVIIPGDGLNNLNWSEDTPFQMARVISEIINELRSKCAPGVEVLVIGCLDQGIVPEEGYYTEARLDEFNALLDLREEQFGKYDYAAPPEVDWDDPVIADPDQRHLFDEGYTSLMNPIVHAWDLTV